MIYCGMRGNMRRAARSPLALMLLFAALAGCSSTGKSPEAAQAINDYYAGNYQGARSILSPMAQKTDENYVLNNLRLGSVALVEYDLQGAETAFFRAYDVINAGGVNKGGRDIAAATVWEGVKIWKGEPFERAMANFDLGLVYYMKKDYANARACFENALFKLRDYGEGKTKNDEYREVESNFAVAYLMLGKAWQKLTDVSGSDEKARAMFDRAVQIRPDLKGLVYALDSGKNNVLLAVEYGLGPQKVTKGDNSIVGFAPLPSQAGPIPLPRVVVDGKAVDLRGVALPPIDLLETAQDRRWQSIDTIRLIKSVGGTALMAAGAYEATRSHNQSNQWAGLAMMLGGAALKASATADTRMWEMLPRTVFLIPLSLPPGRHDVHINFGHVAQTWRGIVAPNQGEATYYMRVAYPRPPMDWPPSTYSGGTAEGAVAPIGSQRISRSN